MRHFSLVTILLALVGAAAVAIVGRSWANDPQPVAKPSNDDPFGGAGSAGPAPHAAATTAPAATQPSAPSSQPSEESMPPGLRPFVPPSPVASSHPSGVHVPQQTQPPRDGRVLTPEMAATREPQAIIDLEDSPAVTKIITALQSPTEIACNKTPLREVLDQLKKLHKIEIQIDFAGLENLGVDPGCPVTKHLSGISLRSALHLLLDELRLQYVIHHEVLLITSSEKAASEEYAATKIYSVKDLILVRNENDEIEMDFQPLIDLIQTFVCCKSWVESGGSQSITAYQFQDRCLLVICQTEEVHEQIAALLAALRRCAAADAKSGNELRLPKRPRSVAPTI